MDPRLFSLINQSENEQFQAIIREVLKYTHPDRISASEGVYFMASTNPNDNAERNHAAFTCLINSGHARNVAMGTLRVTPAGMTLRGEFGDPIDITGPDLNIIIGQVFNMLERRGFVNIDLIYNPDHNEAPPSPRR